MMFSLSRLIISKGKSKPCAILAVAIVSIFLFSMGAAQAATLFTADYEAITYRIAPDGVAVYNVTIHNLDSKDVTFAISVDAADATKWIETHGGESITVPAHQSLTFTLSLIPKSNIAFDIYQVNVHFRGSNGDESVLTFPVDVNIDAFYNDYVPNVALGVTVPAVQDPRQNMKVTVVIRNRNMLDIPSLLIRIRSDFFSTEYNTSLGPRKEKTKEFLFTNLDPLQKPGEYNLHVDIYYPKADKVVAESDSTFRIDSYATISLNPSSETSWFLTKQTVLLTNDGNYERDKEVLINASWPSRIIMWTDPKTELVKVGNDMYFRWDPMLKPTETQQLIIYTNYRPLAILVVLIIIAIILYFVLRSPIVILKEAAVVSKDEHGISEIKVRVFIKNRSRKPLHSLLITDILPRIIELEETNHMGSVKPTRVARTMKKGTLLYWEMDLLDPYEERILTYRAKSKLRIVGDIVLPRARVKFESSKGHERIIVSPVPFFVK